MSNDRDTGPAWRRWAEAFRLWVPLLISICAISLTVFQAMATRRHSRLSVQPRVDWRMIVQDTGEVRIRMVNVGFGPAVVTDVLLSYDGTELGEIGMAACAELDRHLARDDDSWDTECFVMNDEFVLRPGDAEQLYASTSATSLTDAQQRDALINYGKLAINIRYCSFYEECWWLQPR